MQDGQQPNEPGWVFRPGDQSPDLNANQNVPASNPVVPLAEPANPQSAETSPPIAPGNETVAFADDLPHVAWTASEYAAHPKSGGWFALLGLGSIGLAGLVYLITQDYISASVIVVLGLLFGIFAARQPQVLQYSIDNTGIQVDQKFYGYQAFKSFSVVHDQAMGYISLMPLRRFMPPLTIHYDPADEEKIANTLAEYLPYEDHKPDVVDRLARKIRF